MVDRPFARIGIRAVSRSEEGCVLKAVKYAQKCLAGLKDTQ